LIPQRLRLAQFLLDRSTFRLAQRIVEVTIQHLARDQHAHALPSASSGNTSIGNPAPLTCSPIFLTAAKRILATCCSLTLSAFATSRLAQPLTKSNSSTLMR